MPDRIRRVSFISSAAFALSGVLSLSSTRLYSPWLLIAVVAAVFAAPICERLDLRFPVYRKITNVLTFLFTLSLPFWFIGWGMYRGVVGLVVIILVHKFIHHRQPKDYYQLFLMAFSLLLAAGSQHPSVWIAPVLIPFFFSALASLMAAHMLLERQRATDRPALEFVTLDSRAPSKKDPFSKYPAAGVGRWIVQVFAACSLLTLILFIATPRLEAGFIQLRESDRSVTGASSFFELVNYGPINIDSSFVMQVRFPSEYRGRYRGPLYWRVTVYHSLLGSRWERGALSQRSNDPRGQEQFIQLDDHTIARTGDPGRRRIHQRIQLADIPGARLPCLPMPVQVRCTTARVLWEPSDYTVLVSEPVKSLEYDVWSEVPDVDPQQLRNASTDYQSILQMDYGFLTRHFLDSQAVEIAQRITGGQDSVYDKVRAIERWFQSDVFQYTLSPPRVPGSNPVNLFILRTRAGHCQLFASAMANMVRSLGIPARLVSGYRGGDWDSDSRSVIVRQDMAHAWVEVYFIGFGWIPFDPTPTADQLAERTGHATLSTNRFLLWCQYLWYRNVEGYQGAAFRRALLAAVAALVYWLKEAFWLVTHSGVAAVITGGAVLGLLVIARHLRGLRRAVSHRARDTALTPDEQRATGIYRRLKRRLNRCGMPCEGKTAAEILKELRDTHMKDLDPVAHVIHVYHRTRFGGVPMTRNEYRSLVRQVRSLDIG